MKTKMQQILLTLAETYGTTLSPIRLEAYMYVLEELTLEEFKNAYKKIIKDPTITRMPLPAQILASARPKADARSAALESLERIREAVKIFGWPKEQKAKDYLTDQEWAFIERRGGWSHLCGNPENNLNDSIIFAQMRDTLQSENLAIEKGLSFAGPNNKQLGVKQNTNELSSAKSILNGLVTENPER